MEKKNSSNPLRIAGKVSLQIISHGPGNPNATQCRSANDQLAAAVAQHPNRFAGFAALPMTSPTEAADELSRCVTQHRFVGALIDNHTPDGHFFDVPEYDVLWSRAAHLQVPIYIHPAWPSEAMNEILFTGPSIPAGASDSIGSSAFGWHASVGLHLLRLYAAGVFDRFPTLKIIIGHFGEFLPFNLTRIVALSRRWGARVRDLKTVWDENVFITTSGVWSLDPLRCLLSPGNTKVENILYSVDYPFARNEDGLKWMEELETSGLLGKEEIELIAFRNAERLLGVKVS